MEWWPKDSKPRPYSQREYEQKQENTHSVSNEKEEVKLTKSLSPKQDGGRDSKELKTQNTEEMDEAFNPDKEFDILEWYEEENKKAQAPSPEIQPKTDFNNWMTESWPKLQGMMKDMAKITTEAAEDKKAEQPRAGDGADRRMTIPAEPRTRGRAIRRVTEPGIEGIAQPRAREGEVRGETSPAEAARGRKEEGRQKGELQGRRARREWNKERQYK